MKNDQCTGNIIYRIASQNTVNDMNTAIQPYLAENELIHHERRIDVRVL